jgi:serine/threonine-protein kinase
MNVHEALGGRYRLVERLGSGGMSVVWRGHDEVLQRSVAVKMLAPNLALIPEVRRRLHTEALAAARLSHPHIASVYDYGESVNSDDMGVPFVVMELVTGPALAARLAGGTRLPWRDAVITCAQVAAALALAHSQGIVHRDVTPANVLQSEAGAKVVDFGISAVIGDIEHVIDGHIVGTPAYLAPERIDGGPAAPAVDIYALGLVLYRALAGTMPWRAITPVEMLRAHRYADPAPLPSVPGLPAPVARLCMASIDKRASARPNAVQVAQALAAAAEVKVPPLPVPQPVARRRFRNPLRNPLRRLEITRPPTHANLDTGPLPAAGVSFAA